MRVLMNALSATGFSGRHVLLGHLRQLSQWTRDDHEFVVLHHAGNRHLRCDLPGVAWVEAPSVARHWTTRSLWEQTRLPRRLRAWDIDAVVMPSGTVITRCDLPQVTLALNPWCLVPRTQRTVAERAKAAVQRRAYRQAMHRAALMAYASGHIRDAYRRNAGGAIERASEVVYIGLNDETHTSATQLREDIQRNPRQIISVSVMAPWKGIDTVVRAVALLRKRNIDAELLLVGPWPDTAYRRTIEELIDSLGIDGAVRMIGYVDDETLHHHYAESRAFCLMSWCESFGIPSVEAQAFGTPVVGSDCCAMAEVCAQGGVFGPAGDPQVAADLLEPLMTDDARWGELSDAARENASRYTWETCSRPLMRMFECVQ